MSSRMSRREFVTRSAGAAAAAGLGLAQSARGAEGEPLNVLFLMTDQQHWRALHCAGNDLIQTPNLDRLAAEGARFENAFCATPFCTPTRASLVTGVYPHRHGLVTNVQGKESGLTADAVTTAGLLREAGYVTAHRGKWHLGPYADLPYYADTQHKGKGYGPYANEKIPAHQFKDGHDGNLELSGRPVYAIPEVAEAHKEWLQWERRSKQDIAVIGRSIIPNEHHRETWFANRTIELMEQNRDRPWMITCSFSDPHAFWVTPEPYYSMYSRADVPYPPSVGDVHEYFKNAVGAKLGSLIGEAGIREYIAVYYGMVTAVDWNFGRILDKLRELGLEKRTLVVFTSDHGDMQGAHGTVGKSIPAFYDDISRVPLLMRCPGRIEPGTVVPASANSVDIMPTILDYLGRDVPADIDGRSLRPFVEGAPDDGAPGFCERTYAKSRNIQRMICTNEWKYVFASHKGHPRELYHMAEDPHEMTNRIDEPGCQKVRKELHERLREWMIQTKDPYVDRLETA